ncbi:MAG: glycosyltransferase family 2 protein [Pseudomonadota bacterium]
MNREKLTVTIIAYNEEENIRECLQSVEWADEIVVVDGESTDRTVEICKEFTENVFINPWPGHKEQKNFAISKASNLWIFSIDADERVPDELKNFILKELENPASDGYRFPRQNYFLGKWLKHGGWYPDHVLRLFRKDKGSFGGINPHDKVIIESGKVSTVSIPLIHYTYKSISQYVSKQDSYSSISAQQQHGSNKNLTILLLKVIGKPVWKFFETYIIKAGFLDGISGLITAIVASYALFLKQIKIWEINQSNNNDHF